MISKSLKAERIYARFLKQSNIKYVHHPKQFDIENTKYSPDFFLPNENTYIEIKASNQDYLANKYKIDKFKKIYPKIKFRVVSLNGVNLEKKYRDKQVFRSRFRSVKISTEAYNMMKRIAARENRSMSFVLSCATRNLAKAKKII